MNRFITAMEDGTAQLHLLLSAEVDDLHWAMAYGRKHDKGPGWALSRTFGPGTIAAVPCFTGGEAARWAETYEGPAQDQVRAVAALVALREPIPNGSVGDEPNAPRDGGDGGVGDRVPTGPGPMSPSPAVTPVPV